MGELEGPMKEALGFIRLENEKVEVMHKQRQRYILDSERNIAKATAKKEEIDASVLDLNEKQKEILGRKKEKEEAKQNFANFEKEDTGLREDMKSTNVKRKKIKQDVEVEKTKKEKL